MQSDYRQNTPHPELYRAISEDKFLKQTRSTKCISSCSEWLAFKAVCCFIQLINYLISQLSHISNKTLHQQVPEVRINEWNDWHTLSLIESSVVLHELYLPQCPHWWTNKGCINDNRAPLWRIFCLLDMDECKCELVSEVLPTYTSKARDFPWITSLFNPTFSIKHVLTCLTQHEHTDVYPRRVYKSGTVGFHQEFLLVFEYLWRFSCYNSLPNQKV